MANKEYIVCSPPTGKQVLDAALRSIQERSFLGLLLTAEDTEEVREVEMHIQQSLTEKGEVAILGYQNNTDVTLKVVASQTEKPAIAIMSDNQPKSG